MPTIKFGPNRAYPSLPAVSGNLENHTTLLAAIREAMEVHERRTGNYLDSFVRLRELVDLGLVTMDGSVGTTAPVGGNGGGGGGGDLDPLYVDRAGEDYNADTLVYPGSVAFEDNLLVGAAGSEQDATRVDNVQVRSRIRASSFGSGNPASMIAHQHSTSVFPEYLLARSNSTGSGHAAVTNDMRVGQVRGVGWAHSTPGYLPVGEIAFEVDAAGTVGAASMPGRIVLSTTKDGEKVPTPALTLDAMQRAYFGGNISIPQGDGIALLGIGERTANRAELHLYSHGNNPADINFGVDNIDDANMKWTFSSRGSGQSHRLYLYEAPFNTGNGFQVRVAFAPGGNVGIGTSNPQETLHVGGTALVTGAAVFTAAGTRLTAPIQIHSDNPAMTWFEESGDTNGKGWDIMANNSILNLRTMSDAGGGGQNIMQVFRSGTTVTQISMFAGGTEQLRATRHTVAPATTGARVRHSDGVLYDVGMNVMHRVDFSANTTVQRIHVGKRLRKTGTGTVTLTLADDSDIPNDSVVNVYSRGGTVNINTSGTLRWYGDSTETSGNRVLAAGGVCTICKISGNTWEIWGAGLS